VRFPRGEAYPAEVVFAPLADHVVATAVLLNRRLALRTFLPSKSTTFPHQLTLKRHFALKMGFIFYSALAKDKICFKHFPN